MHCNVIIYSALLLIYMYCHSQKFDKSYSEECCHQMNLFNFCVTLGFWWVHKKSNIECFISRVMTMTDEMKYGVKIWSLCSPLKSHFLWDSGSFFMGLIHHLIDFLHTVQLKISKRYGSTQNMRKKTGPDKSASFEFHTVTSAESIDYQVNST